MRDSILLTVYDRPERVLFNTFHSLRRNDLTGSEIVIVDDGSTKDYGRIKAYLMQYEVPFEWITVDTIKDRPGTYNLNGYNNPAYAWNCALDAAKGARITVLSSDCIIPPHMMNHARLCRKSIWMSTVVDIDSGTIFLGRERIAPYGWCMSWNRENAPDVRWDEMYLKGMGFDDNDITAQLAVAHGEVRIDPGVTAFHQSHLQMAYSDGHYGMDINERYTCKKWGGVPWYGGDDEPLGITQGRRAGEIVLHVERKSAEAETLTEQHGVA